MRVLVTGAGARLAAAVLPRLCAHPAVIGVTGLDLRPARYAHPKLRAIQADIRSDTARAALAGHDAVIHMAYVVLRGRTALADMADVNVRGSHALLMAARAAGVRRLVHVSSAAVYGGGEHVAEDAPLRPLPGFAYAAHKARLEALIARDLPECVRLRPHAILGPHAHELLVQLLRQPCYPRLPDPQPRLQCVHEDDVAQAVMLALCAQGRGPYNLAAAGDFCLRDAVGRNHGIAVAVPLPLARAALALAWRLTGWGGEPGWLPGLSASLTLDCTRARAEFGWRPAHTMEAILGRPDGAAAHCEHRA